MKPVYSPINNKLPINKPISSNNNGQYNPNTNTHAHAQLGDLSVLSISNNPYFSYYVQKQYPKKTFIKKPEYQYLHPLPAELLQDIESEPTEWNEKLSDQQHVNDFRQVYDDFYTRTRIYAPEVGEKVVPPTRPYVLFTIFYDQCKVQAKNLNLQEYEVSVDTLFYCIYENKFI